MMLGTATVFMLGIQFYGVNKFIRFLVLNFFVQTGDTKKNTVPTYFERQLQ